MTGIERLVDIVNDGPYSGGMIHISVQKLREICEQIEREQDAAVKDSPYDAILTEDREAIAWVREHGGLEAVRERWAGRIARAHVEHMAERQRERRERMQRHIEYIQRLCRERRERIGELNREIADMRPRLMPEGCKWPRYESGDLVEVGDEVVGTDYGEHIRADEITFHANGFTLRDKTGLEHWYVSDDRFERPAVLAADGEPLEVGQTVWDVKSGAEHKVIDVKGDCVITNGHGYSGTFHDGKQLTHQRPVLDADGVPIKKGDTVYGTVEGGPFIVTEVSGKGSVFVDAFPDTGMHGSMLTHTKPEPSDSWEKVEKDTDLKPRGYVDLVLGWDMSKNHSENQARWAMTHDLVRRCRALAERERGE